MIERVSRGENSKHPSRSIFDKPGSEFLFGGAGTNCKNQSTQQNRDSELPVEPGGRGKTRDVGKGRGLG